MVAVGAGIALAAMMAGPVLAISNRTLLTATGNSAFEFMGASVAAAGDVNGDGFQDVIVGAYGGNTGRAFIYYGGRGTDATADVTLTGSVPSGQFGQSVAGAGDINGDGYADVIVGASGNGGYAHVFFGGQTPHTTPDLILTGFAGDDLGWSVAGAGDVNHDGYADVIVGAPLDDEAGVDAGRAYLYFGGPAADANPDLTLTGLAATDIFGISVAGAGDVNGDGFGDMIVGAAGNDTGNADVGQAYVFFGGSNPDAVADLTMTGTGQTNMLGWSVAGVGDMNGDHYADVIVGAPNGVSPNGNNAGQAFVFFGGPSPDAIPDVSLNGAAPNDALGSSVGSAMDVNRDGFSDVIVGATGSLTGHAFVVLGGSTPDSNIDASFAGNAPGDIFGKSVAGIGDMNGDGFGEVIIGAYLNDAGGQNAGQCYVKSFFPYVVVSPNGSERWRAGSDVAISWLGHDEADIALSLDGGLTWTPIATEVGGAEQNTHHILAPTILSQGARVRLSYSGQPATLATSDLSDGVFSIVQARRVTAAATRLEVSTTGAANLDLFGGAVANAGDVNGDGYSDTIVGAYQNDAGGADAGRAYIYYNAPDEDSTPEITLTDGVAGDNFGFSVSSAGDVNGDGFADVIVGAPFNDLFGPNAGRAYVYYGGPFADNFADIALANSISNDFLGYSVAGAGDVNGDGFDDVIVGCYGNDTGGSGAGNAILYYGGAVANAIPDLFFTGLSGNDFFGYSVAGAGDVNGDGFADIIIGAISVDTNGPGSGAAYVYYGGQVPNSDPDLTMNGEAAFDSFGTSVAGAGDVNGDGFADVIVGAWQNTGGPEKGRAYVFYGGPNADATADLTMTGAGEGDLFGTSVAGAGDVNADGFADVLVGAPMNDPSQSDAGRAYIFFGGQDAQADLTLTGSSGGDRLGNAVAGGGDVNGDGFDDVLIGVPFSDGNGVDKGRVDVQAVNRYRVVAPNGGETWNVGARRSISWQGAELADVWLSVDGGASYELLESGVGGAEVNSIPLRIPHQPTRYARVQITPSDPELTGVARSDSIFTIQSSVGLLRLEIAHDEGGSGGTNLSWATEPAVGPEGIAGYRLFRLSGGGAGRVRVGPELILETSYTDPEGGSGSRYQLMAVNGLGEELLLAETASPVRTPLAAWPLPYRGGALNIAFATIDGLGGAPAQAEVRIYDLNGRLVRTVARGNYGDGVQTASWDGRDDDGHDVAAGVYFIRSQTGREERRLKLVVLR